MMPLRVVINTEAVSKELRLYYLRIPSEFDVIAPPEMLSQKHRVSI
jgi:hypothetical protein